MSTRRSAATSANAPANVARAMLPALTAARRTHAAAATEPIISERRSSKSDPTSDAYTSSGKAGFAAAWAFSVGTAIIARQHAQPTQPPPFDYVGATVKTSFRVMRRLGAD